MNNEMNKEDLYSAKKESENPKSDLLNSNKGFSFKMLT